MGEQDVTTAIMVDNYGNILSKLDNLAAARSCHERALAVFIRLLGENDHHVSIALANLAEVLTSQREFLLAQLAYDKALAIDRRLFGNEHPAVAATLNDLALCFQSQGDHAAAQKHCEQALAIRRKLRGDLHADVAQSLHNLASIYMDQGRLAEALRSSQQSLAIYRQVLGNDQPMTARSLAQLSQVRFRLGTYAEASECSAEVHAIYRKLWGESNPRTVMAKQGLAMMLKFQGKTQEAQALLQEALERCQAAHRGPHPNTATILTNLGAIHREQGDPSKCRIYLEQALAMWRQLADKDKSGHASTLTNMGSLLSQQGDQAAARDHYIQARDILLRLGMEQSSEMAEVLNNLGLLLADEGFHQTARDLHEQALKIRRRCRAAHHPEIAHNLVHLGHLHEELKDWANARRCYEEALAIHEQALGREHPHTAHSLEGLASVLLAQGDIEAAQTRAEQALAIRRQSGTIDVYTVACLRLLGTVAYARGELARARLHFDQALAVQQQVTTLLLGSLSESEALSCVASIPLTRDLALSVLRKQAADAMDAYLAVWQTRGLTYQMVASRRPVENADPKARELWDQLRRKRAELAGKSYAAALTAEERARELSRLTAEKEELERQLVRLSTRFARELETQRLAPQDLASRLPGHVAVVDLVRVDFWNQAAEQPGMYRQTTHYEAFVLRGGNGAPLRLNWIHLGPAAPIDAAVTDLRTRILRRQVYPGGADAGPQRLRRLVWEPIEKHLDGCNAVILIPDGALTQLPWGALPGRQAGRYLLEEYVLSIAGDGQQLEESLTPRASPDGQLLLVGGVDYEQLPAASSPPTRLPTEQRRWEPLANTLPEVRAIAEFWPGKTTVLEGSHASRTAVHLHLPTARYVHLATHGFFADSAWRSAYPLEPKSEEATLADFALGRASAAGRNPLLLSGIVLAGANRSVDGHNSAILTAEEVVDLDLRRTELVVLSACETGLGEVQAGGEGVFGLQRAFGQAGARSVVASLWKVPDQETRQLMTRFYDNLWRANLPPAEALRKAQLSLLEPTQGQSASRGFEPISIEQRDSARNQPWRWAAWTLSGYPGDLPGPSSRPSDALVQLPGVRPHQPTPAQSPPISLLWLLLLVPIVAAGSLLWRQRRGELIGPK